MATTAEGSFVVAVADTVTALPEAMSREISGETVPPSAGLAAATSVKVHEKGPDITVNPSILLSMKTYR